MTRIDHIQERLAALQDMATQIAGHPCQAEFTTRSDSMHVWVRHQDILNGAQPKIYAQGVDVDECFHLAYARLFAFRDERQQRVAELARTLGVEEAA